MNVFRGVSGFLLGGAITYASANTIQPNTIQPAITQSTVIQSSVIQPTIRPPEPDPDPAPQVPATNVGCPDYRGALDLPLLTLPQKMPFQSMVSRYWSKKHSPYHMVHDEMVNPGQALTVVGKFDYSRVYHKDLEHEFVHAYLYGTDMRDWLYLGRYTTDSDGKVYVPVHELPEGEYIVRMVVEGDLSQADGFVSVIPKGQQAVLFDMDGTLTLSDFEQVGDYLGVSTAKSKVYAKEMVQTYINKGYRVIYVTGRPYWNARDTREWFTRVIDLPQWPLRTNNDGGSPLHYQTEAYKRAYLTGLQQHTDIDIVRAYGNASTDITAYVDAGIPSSKIWIIGENAGAAGTHPIEDDYQFHYVAQVETMPEAQCRL